MLEPHAIEAVLNGPSAQLERGLYTTASPRLGVIFVQSQVYTSLRLLAWPSPDTLSTQSSTLTMPSPFHQKYSSQSHKVFGDNTVPAMPEAPKDDAQRRGSDSSITEPSSPDARRRVR